ncbi:transcription termination factor Rho [Bifidobacterium phasiani]|uniref:Transcription termination factor Rho n=1 Tax=Bifidobacterium phasiani TaxID=2834431 RepID=A0ABS6W9W0_9BIFI|nr:transcription termination factor Rho [Bifidobacterium phasiani]
MANSQNLEDMRLPELKELAKQMGLRGTSTMRKPELLATLQAARSGGEAPEGVTVRVPDAPVKTAPSEAAPSQETPQVQAPAGRPEPAPAEQAAPAADAVDEAAMRAVQEAGRDGESARGQRRERDRKGEERGSRRASHGRRSDDIAATLLDELDLKPAESKRDEAQERRRQDDDRQDEGQPMRRRRRGGEQSRGERREGGKSAGEGNGNVHDLDDILASLPGQKGDEPAESGAGEEHEFSRRSRGRDRGNDRRQQRRRGRDRDLEEREEPQEDLVPVAGIVDVLDSYAFIRTSGYLPGPNDVYVSMGQVKKYGLRKGDAVHGTIRPPREGERRNQRQKFVPLQAIDSINGMSVEEAANRPQFAKLTPLYPQERLKQETTPNKLTGRLIDIVAPIGKGQRGLIVSPPKAGKTITLQNIANAIATNNPEVHLMVVLVDERPEEVTDMERTVQGEVISSTFDRPASDHTTVAELAIERAKRLVELGQDVVVLLDSMTRLARAYNIAAPASGRILSGGVDAQALYPPKKFFGAARNIENGGSLTIISSALVETGSKMDEVIFEEFKGTGNMELKLSRELADKRLFPAIDVNSSGTRREELITPPDELSVVYRLRRLLGGLEPEQAYQTLVPRLKKTPTNRDFLAAIVQQSNSSAINGN